MTKSPPDAPTDNGKMIAAIAYGGFFFGLPLGAVPLLMRQDEFSVYHGRHALASWLVHFVMVMVLTVAITVLSLVTCGFGSLLFPVVLLPLLVGAATSVHGLVLALNGERAEPIAGFGLGEMLFGNIEAKERLPDAEPAATAPAPADPSPDEAPPADAPPVQEPSAASAAPPVAPVEPVADAVPADAAPPAPPPVDAAPPVPPPADAAPPAPPPANAAPPAPPPVGAGPPAATPPVPPPAEATPSAGGPPPPPPLDPKVSD